MLKDKIEKDMKTLVHECDYGWDVGFAIDCMGEKVEKFKLGRYIKHLLLVIESKNRSIRQKDAEVLVNRKELLETEERILSVYKKVDESTKKLLEEEFSFFLPEAERDD